MANVTYLSGGAVKALPLAPEDTSEMFAAVLDGGRAWIGYYPLERKDEIGAVIWFPPEFLKHGRRSEVAALLLYPRMLRCKVVCYPHNGHSGAVRALLRAGFKPREDGGYELDPWNFQWPVTKRGRSR